MILLLLLAAVCEGSLQGSAPETRCVFQGKSLDCEILTDGKNSFNCTVCPHSGTVSPPCPTRNARHKDCHVKSGVCHFHCDPMVNCLETHWLIFDRFSPLAKQTETSCKVVETQLLFKPEPVQDLTLTLINSTVVKVKFMKPVTQYKGKKPLYKYKVKYRSNNSKFSGQLKIGKRSDSHVEITLDDLQPAENYSVSVIARPEKKGYRSKARTKWVELPEAVPLSGPRVPEGGFSVCKHYIVLYLKRIPFEERRGRIQHYKVSVDQCDQQNITSFDHYWSVFNLTACSLGPFEVETSAGTMMGWSQNPSVFHINPQLYKENHVEGVYKENGELVWTFPDDRHIDSFTVFSCYGTKDEHSPLLIKCKVPIENVTVGAEARSLPLEDRDVPETVCSLCQWQYGVSVNVAGVGAGITWNALPEQEHLSTSGLHISYIYTIVGVVGVCVISFGAFLLWFLVKQKPFCKEIFIVLPKMPSDEISDEAHGTRHHNSKAKDTDKPTIRYHRDSGNFSMTTLRHETEEAKRLTSTSEEEKDEQPEDISGEADVCRSSQVEEGMWSSTDNSAMSDYRQVAGSQEELEAPPVMYSDLTSACSSSVSEYDSSATFADKSATTYDMSGSITKSSACITKTSDPANVRPASVANASDPIIGRSAQSTNTSALASDKSASSSNISTHLADTSASTTDTSASTLSSDVSSGTNTSPPWPTASASVKDTLLNDSNINHEKLEASVKISPSSLGALPARSSLPGNSSSILGFRTPINGDITRESGIIDEDVPLMRKDSVEQPNKAKRSHYCDANDTESSIGSYSEFHCDAI